MSTRNGWPISYPVIEKTKEPLNPLNEKGHYFLLTEYLFDRVHKKNEQGKLLTDMKGRFLYDESVFNRNLVLKEQLLVANDLPADVEWAITHGEGDERKNAFKKVRKLILSGRDFRYADFSEAILPRVDFVVADDKVADLSYANFFNAILNDARISGVELQGPDLENTYLKLAKIDGVEIGLLTEQSVNEWIEKLAKKVEDEKIFNRINARVSERIGQPAMLDNSYGKEIWAKAAYGDDIHTLLFGFGNALYGASDKSVYFNSLYPYLIELVCENRWIASSIIRN